MKKRHEQKHEKKRWTNTSTMPTTKRKVTLKKFIFLCLKKFSIFRAFSFWMTFHFHSTYYDTYCRITICSHNIEYTTCQCITRTIIISLNANIYILYQVYIDRFDEFWNIKPINVPLLKHTFRIDFRTHKILCFGSLLLYGVSIRFCVVDGTWDFGKWNAQAFVLVCSMKKAWIGKFE